MKKILSTVALGAILASGSFASSLKVGLASGALTMDPQLQNETATTSILTNIFDTLVAFDKDLNPIEGLAYSWENTSPKEWIFKLRKNVKFHNGNDFNADDVVFSFDRIKNWAQSGFKGKVSMVEKAEKIDDYTVKIITKEPYPILPRKLTYVKILDKETLDGKSDSWIGLNPIGTGAYKLVSWAKGDHIKLKANDSYWKGKPDFTDVTLRPLTNDATRVAAILSGEVDLIDQVPVVDVQRIKKNNKLNYFIEPGLRLIFLCMDQDRDNSPYIKTHNGKNPFKDVRVRKALYYGINEDAIVKFIMKGYAKPAGQFSPKAVFGHDESIKRVKYDPKKAKELLTEAGYPDGFEVTLDSPNNRYINDEQIAQAVASSLAKIGIKVKVNATPKSTFFTQTENQNTSFFLFGWANNDGDISSSFDAIVHSHDNKKGYGRYNSGRFSNQQADKLIESSSGELDSQKRLKQLHEAQKIAIVDEQAFIPLHYQVDIYASNKKINFAPRIDTLISVFDIKQNAK